MSEPTEKHGENRAKHPQWLPGQSGNPAGRPKGSGLTDRLRRIIDSEVDRKHVGEALMEAGVRAALKGDFRFWQEILNRVDGKVPDRQAGHDGGPLPGLIFDPMRQLLADPDSAAAARLIAKRLGREAPALPESTHENGHANGTANGTAH